MSIVSDYYRLPSDIVPEAYKITLTPDFETFEYAGEMELEVNVEHEGGTERIILHAADDLVVTDVQVVDASGRQHSAKVVRPGIHDYLYLDMLDKVSVSGSVTVSLKFTGPLRENLYGFYRSSYTGLDGQKHMLATTQFEATSARYAFPCMDEPALKATFEMTINAPAGYIALGNMPSESVANSDGSTTYTFDRTVKMSTYLVAFIVCDFESTETLVSATGVNVRVWTQPGHTDEAQFALEAGRNVLGNYSDYFGIDFPLPKLDMVAIPDFAAGAMENWGLVTYRDTALLIDEDDSSTSNVQRVAVVVAHELAHQWFGNLVTMEWWSALWLNEGFASRVEYLGVNFLYPEWDMYSQFIYSDEQRALKADSLATSHSITPSYEVDSTELIENMFDSISYSKGASIIAMLDHYMDFEFGQGSFRVGLQKYLEDFSFSNAEPTDLWSEMDDDGKVLELMNGWTNQAGYPLITLTYADGKVTATQKRFFLVDGDEEETPTRWIVPLVYQKGTDADDQVHHLTLDAESVQIDLGADEWIKMNHDSEGFYRTDYDDELWARLLEVVTDLHPKDRANIVDDVFSMTEAGVRPVSRALDLVAALSATEDDYIVWDAILSHLYNIDTYLDTRASYGPFRVWVRSMLAPIYNDLGWTVAGKHTAKLLREAILPAAVHFDVGDAVSRGQALFAGDLADIAPDVRSAAYSAGVAEGGEDAYNRMLAHYQSVTFPSELRRSLKSLAKTRVPYLVQKTLDSALDLDIVRSQDTVSLIVYVANSVYGRDPAWLFLRENWDELIERYGGGGFAIDGLIQGAVRNFGSQSKYDEVKTFFDEHMIDSIRGPASHGLETIRSNMQWLEKNEAKVIEWLDANGRP